MAEPETQYADFNLVKSYAYGMDIPDEFEEEVVALIVKAERRLLRRASSIPKRIEDGRLSKEDVADVVADMVLRVVKNPGGYSSEQAGEFSYRIDWGAASGRIHVTKEDLQNLGLGASGATIGVVRSQPPAWRIV